MTFQGIDESIDAITAEGGSNLPSWYRNALINRQRQLGELQRDAPSLTVTIPNRAPGWHEVGMEISCVPESVYPWDPQVFTAIQKIAPDLVPVWVRWVFVSPQGETVVFGRHALARVNKAKKREVTPAVVDVLQRADHIFIEELRRHGLYDKVSQAFAVFLPVKSVGVTGDQRCVARRLRHLRQAAGDLSSANEKSPPAGVMQ